MTVPLMFIRVDDAALAVQLSRSALSRLVKKKRLHAHQIGKRQFFVREEIEQFAEERGVHGKSTDAAGRDRLVVGTAGD